MHSEELRYLNESRQFLNGNAVVPIIAWNAVDAVAPLVANAL